MQYKNSNDPAKSHAASLQRVVRFWVIPGGGGVYSDIFIYIRRLGPFFGFKILNFIIFCGVQKMNIFGV